MGRTPSRSTSSPMRSSRLRPRRDPLMPTAILALGVLLSAFLLGLIFGGPYIRLLRRFGIGQNIRREGPTRDFAKQGIPAMVGALLAFLWFNVHPAEVIMGDTGALAIGATLAACALTTGFVLLLPVAGVIFVAETVSVIIQVGSFKLRGKRIFRMSPLHNHFELIGWPEEKVTIRFWLIAALAGIVAAILAFATPIL